MCTHNQKLPRITHKHLDTYKCAPNSGYVTLASGKLYHPNRPPMNDYPASWTTDADINPYYWGV